MEAQSKLIRVISVVAFLLITEPFFKVAVMKIQTGLEWSLVWSNILDNSHSFSRFFLFWILSPLTGIFLLTYSSVAYALYFLLSGFRVYLLLNYTPFDWPYFSTHPPLSAYLFEIVNMALFSYLFYPIVQRFILSRYLRNYWDARGRIECKFDAYLFIEGFDSAQLGTVQNISSGGVSIEVPKLDHKVGMGKISFIDPFGVPFSCDFKCASKRGSGDSVTLGLEFQNITPKEKIYLRSSFKEFLPVENLNV
jgi:hypothetical protein